jgi:translation initiation factor 2 gamma subunit (eIF-2gamma)
MMRIFLAVVVAGLLLLGAAVLLLGAFPPQPHPQPVEKTLPNDKFPTR